MEAMFFWSLRSMIIELAELLNSENAENTPPIVWGKKLFL